MSPTTTPVVVVGAGIVGAASAYFLRRRGFDVTIVEAASPASGATGLASGGVRTQFASPVETQLTMRSRRLWREFETRHRLELEYHRVGYLSIGSTPDSTAELLRRREFQSALNVHAQELSAAELQKLIPGLRTDDIEIAVFTPDDGYSSPSDITGTVLAQARASGVTVRLRTRVVDIDTSGGAVAAAVCASGERIPCQVLVNAAGLGAPALSATLGLHTPVTAYRQHQFLTEPVVDVDTRTLPNVLEPALNLYLRGEGSGVLLGISNDAEVGRTDTNVTWDLLEPLGERLEHRWPRLTTAGIARGWVGCYEVTPDRRALLGTSDALEGFICAAGFSGHGFMHGFASGDIVAALAVGAEPTFDIGELSIDRFGASPATAGQQIDSADERPRS